MTVSTLFDFNGVLVDDESVHLAAFRAVMAPLGIVIDDATYAARYLGFDDAGAFRAMLVDSGAEPTDAEVARLVEAKKPLYMELIADGLVVFEGAADLVRRRAALGPVGIVSGALRHEIEHALGVMGSATRSPSSSPPTTRPCASRTPRDTRSRSRRSTRRCRSAHAAARTRS